LCGDLDSRSQSHNYRKEKTVKLKPYALSTNPEFGLMELYFLSWNSTAEEEQEHFICPGGRERQDGRGEQDGRGQGRDSRTRGNHARGLINSLHAVFARYLRGNHVRYIYGSILKYTANTGDSVFFLVVGGRRVFKFRVWCACLSHYSPFLSSRSFLPPCACAFSCSVHRHGPWLCAFLFAIAHSSPLDSTAAVFIIMGRG